MVDYPDVQYAEANAAPLTVLATLTLDRATGALSVGDQEKLKYWLSAICSRLTDATYSNVVTFIMQEARRV